MISNAKELKECLVWTHSDQLTKGATSKCPEAKITMGYSSAYASLTAEFYNEQPVDILTVSCSEVLSEFEDYKP